MTIIDELVRTREETLGRFTLAGPALERCYAPGKWSVRFLLHHLSDSEMVLLERIKRILGERGKVIWAFDQDGWARALDYASAPLDLARDSFAAARAGIIHLAERHYVQDGHLTWVHSETGLRTLQQEFDKVASHNAQHLAQITAALDA